MSDARTPRPRAPQVRALAETVGDEFGGLDGLVNTAGIAGEAGEVTGLDVDLWKQLFAVNVEGPMLCIKHCVPLMRSSGSGGSVINVSSNGGGPPSPRPPWCAASGRQSRSQVSRGFRIDRRTRPPRRSSKTESPRLETFT